MGLYSCSFVPLLLLCGWSQAMIPREQRAFAVEAQTESSQISASSPVLHTVNVQQQPETDNTQKDQPSANVQPNLGQVAFLPHQQFVYTTRNTNTTTPDSIQSTTLHAGPPKDHPEYIASRPDWRDPSNMIPSLHDNIILNGDFLTGDLSGWVIDSPDSEAKWNVSVVEPPNIKPPAVVRRRPRQQHRDSGTAGKDAGAEKPALRVLVPQGSYVMMFQDVDYNSSSSFSDTKKNIHKDTAETSASAPSENPAPKMLSMADDVDANPNLHVASTTTIPFTPGDTYTLTFSYRFLSGTDPGNCSQSRSSVYYGIVNADDVVEIEDDIYSEHDDKGYEKNSENATWSTLVRDFTPTTSWGSLYLYFMSPGTEGEGGEGGGKPSVHCVNTKYSFEIAEIGIWRVAV